MTISGNNASRIFQIDSGATASISGVTITNGSAPVGGGVYSAGSLTLTNTTVSSSVTTGPGGGQGNGGGIDSASGSLTLTSCTITANHANSSGYGGGVYIGTSTGQITGTTLSNNFATDGAGLGSGGGTITIGTSTISNNSATTTGGGVASNSTLTINSSTISGNTATSGSGGGVYTNSSLTMDSDVVSGNTADTGGGIANNSTTFKLTNSTISGNTATGLGGGGMNDNRSTAVLINDTISGNQATGTQFSYEGQGGGILAGGSDPTSLTDVTISNNTAAEIGGGIDNETGGVAFTVGNTIIAGNTAPADPDVFDEYGVTSNGYNLIGKTDGSSGWVAADKTGTVAAPLDPKLGALANNGGATLTQLPVAGSPAIDAGSNALIPSGVTSDQRGDPRIVNSVVDIGAVETAAQASVAIKLFTVDDGSTQRSRVRTLTLAFTAPVTLDATAIGFLRTSSSPSSAVSYTSSTPDGGLTYVITPNQYVTGASLIDGNYSLTVNPSGVHPVSNPSSSMSGSAQTFTFSRLFGDSNGDGVVNLVDYKAFAASFLKSSGTTGYNFEFDSNNDGTINLTDYRAFASNFLHSITM